MQPRQVQFSMLFVDPPPPLRSLVLALHMPCQQCSAFCRSSSAARTAASAKVGAAAAINSRISTAGAVPAAARRLSAAAGGASPFKHVSPHMTADAVLSMVCGPCHHCEHSKRDVCGHRLGFVRRQADPTAQQDPASQTRPAQRVQRRVPQSQQQGDGGLGDFFKGDLPKKLAFMLVRAHRPPPKPLAAAGIARLGAYVGKVIVKCCPAFNAAIRTVSSGK